MPDVALRLLVTGTGDLSELMRDVGYNPSTPIETGLKILSRGIRTITVRSK